MQWGWRAQRRCPPRGAGPHPVWAAAALLLALGARPVSAGGGGGLWKLGDEVDKNPITVFSMFVLTVVFTVVVEVSKHAIEHRTSDLHRRQALQAIYAELMMLGIVSFLLVLGAELGMQDIRIRKPGCDSSASGSGSGPPPDNAPPPTAAPAAGGAPPPTASPTAPPTAPPAPPPASGCTWALKSPGQNYACSSPTPCAAFSSAGNATYTCAPAPAPPTMSPSGSSAGSSGGSAAGSAAGTPPGSSTGSGASSPTSSTSGTTAGSAAAASGSGSGDPCMIGFDILMFEYAHLVLFFMGISYAVFIQVAFWQRDRAVEAVRQAQSKSLVAHMQETPGGWKDPSVMAVMGLGDSKGWSRAVLMLRNIMALRHEEELVDCCNRTEDALVRATSLYLGQEAPCPLPVPEEAVHAFDMSRLCKIAVSEVMVELLHVPPSVWLAVIFMSATNLLHMALDVDLAIVTIGFAPFGMILSLLQLKAMAGHMISVLHIGCGHSRMGEVEHHSTGGAAARGTLQVPAKWLLKAKQWEEGDDSMHPWHKLDGCCDDESAFNALDPLDPHALEVQMQVTIFACCFFVGVITMLTVLIFESIGMHAVILCWILPLVPLGIFVPRCILIYSLVHRTNEPPRAWLKYALKDHDDPSNEHGHGHGGHGHGGHDHDHEEKSKEEKRRDIVEELKKVLKEEGHIQELDGTLNATGKRSVAPRQASTAHDTLTSVTMGSEAAYTPQRNVPLKQPLLGHEVLDELAVTMAAPGPSSTPAGRGKPLGAPGSPRAGGFARQRSGEMAPRTASALSVASSGDVPCCPVCGSLHIMPDGAAFACHSCGQRMELPRSNTPVMAEPQCEQCGNAQLVPDGAGRLLCESCGHRQKPVLDPEIDPRNPFRKRRERRHLQHVGSSPTKSHKPGLTSAGSARTLRRPSTASNTPLAERRAGGASFDLGLRQHTRSPRSGAGLPP
eukprot:TRINITY_DN1137_c0_g5_i1.p1 TRINITY_DN1137_c0_g5~~TRINITY_DN1137_c0_g5_i1.p1  ORF type:complete len:978 (+),score=254.37 TRINITY_DN1137_c0_g5_i1:77-2935(+)